MHAVLIEVDTSGQPDPAVGLKHLREQTVPGVSQAPGFQAGYWLRPLADAKGTSLVLFDTEANAEAVLRYLSPQIEWELLALTEHWRRELKIVFRKRSTDRA